MASPAIFAVDRRYTRSASGIPGQPPVYLVNQRYTIGSTTVDRKKSPGIPPVDRKNGKAA